MSGFSWVTLATNDSYSLGALVLAHSLKRVGTAHQQVVMVTPGVTQPMREKLRSVFDLVFEVNILDSKDERNLLLLQRPELGITFTKLHCWRLTQYNKCVFLDADTLVLQNCDELFDRDEFSAAPDVGWPDCFNSGVFVYKPSDETFNSLLAFALERGSFDGGDQGLLNLYFSDWAHTDISRHLPFIYNMCSTACYSYLPAFKQFGENVKIIHFIGNSKPWLQYFNSETLHVDCNPGFEHLQLVFEHWWNLFCSNVHSGLQPTMARINTPIASSCTSSAHTLAYYINESKCEDSLCTEQFCGTDLNNIPVWDPWENYLPIDNSVEIQSTDNVSFVDNLNNEPSSSSCHVEIIVENKIESSFHDSCKYNAQANDVSSKTNVEFFDCNSHINTDSVHSFHDSCNYSAQTNDASNIMNVEFVDCKSHINTDSVHSSFQNEHVNNVSITNDPPPHFCTYSQPQSLDPSPPGAYESVTSTVVCDAMSASTVTITTEQPATNASKTETRTNSNGGLAGAFAQMTLRQPRSADQGALEEHLRRQGWEAGRIDYLGQDSFENVWKKICETMSTTPKKQPSPTKEIPAPVTAVPTAEPVSAPVVTPALAESVTAPLPALVAEASAAPAPAEIVAPPMPVLVAEAAAAPPAPVAGVVTALAPVAEPIATPTPAPVAEPAVAPLPVDESVVSSAPVTESTSALAPTSAVVSAPTGATTPPSQPAVDTADAPVLPVETAAAPGSEPAAVPAPITEPAAVPAPVPKPAAVPASVTEPVVTTTPVNEPNADPVPVADAVIAPIPTAESVSAPAPVPEPVATTAPVSESAAPPSESAAPPALASIPIPESTLAPVNVPASETVATLVPETVATLVPETVAAPIPAPVPTPVSASAPEVVAAPSPVPESAPLPSAVATSKSASVPVTEAAPAPIAEPVTVSAPAPSSETVAVPAAATLAELIPEAPKEISKATQAAKPAPAAPIAKTEGKKEATKSKPESAEGQSSESTPVPPPRKSGKSGGATAKKSPKKK